MLHYTILARTRIIITIWKDTDTTDRLARGQQKHHKLEK
jgi:hypothetical protein